MTSSEAKSARLAEYLGHIVAAVERIERYTSALDAATFLDNEMAQDAVIRNLEVIGEASRNIERADPAFAQAHPELPLRVAYEMRNALAHGYFTVDLVAQFGDRTVHKPQTIRVQ